VSEIARRRTEEEEEEEEALFPASERGRRRIPSAMREQLSKYTH
jgi:hypothetical protein